jgi:hypothetical protein
MYTGMFFIFLLLFLPYMIWRALAAGKFYFNLYIPNMIRMHLGKASCDLLCDQHIDHPRARITCVERLEVALTRQTSTVPQP